MIPRAAAMTEAQLQEAVRKLCKQYGLLYYHVADSRRSDPGWPDVIAAGPRGLLASELKSLRGKLTPEQRRWGSYLGRHMTWTVWRPADYIDGTVERMLERIA